MSKDYQADESSTLKAPSDKPELWWSRKGQEWVVVVAKDWYTARILLKWNIVQSATNWRKELLNAETVSLSPPG